MKLEREMKRGLQNREEMMKRSCFVFSRSLSFSLSLSLSLSNALRFSFCRHKEGEGESIEQAGGFLHTRETHSLG